MYNQLSYVNSYMRGTLQLEERLTYNTLGCSNYSEAFEKCEASPVYFPENPSLRRGGMEKVLDYQTTTSMNNSLDSFIEENNPGYISSGNERISAYIPSSMDLPRQDSYLQKTIKTSYVSHPDVFVKQHCPVRFIDSSDEVQELVEETFFKVTGKKLSNISIKVCEEEEMKRLHHNWHPGILGFSLNLGIGNMVFAKKESVERLLITIGHEIGHVVSPMLSDEISEEAKAFAFELAWVKAIKEHDIGGLGNCLKQGLPAENGIHDKAFGFVLQKVKQGEDPFGLHKNICEGIVKTEAQH